MQCPECDRIFKAERCPCGWLPPAQPTIRAPYIPPAPQEFRPKPKGTSWRERWYQDRGLPYKPANLKDCGFLRSINSEEKIRMPVRDPGCNSEDLEAA